MLWLPFYLFCTLLTFLLLKYVFKCFFQWGSVGDQLILLVFVYKKKNSTSFFFFFSAFFLSVEFLFSWVGEGNGIPLQYSCLENPMDGGAWWAAVHGSQRVRHDWATSLSLFTFMHWRRKWQPTPVFLSGESQGWRSLVGCHLWGRTELAWLKWLSSSSRTLE